MMDKFSTRSAPRFHVNAHLSPGAEVDLPERASRHITVLRLRQGDEITLFTGESGEYRAVLTRLTRTHAAARVIEWRDVERESPLDITLAQCISSDDRMDLTL